MNLVTAFTAHYHRPPKKGELGDPVVVAALRKTYADALLLTQPQKQASRVMFAFPEITDATQNTYFFGGNQLWYERKTQRLAGCGPVAAANILACLGAQNQEIAAALGLRFTLGSQLSKASFMLLMQRIYRVMGTLEIPVLNHLADKSNNAKPLLPPSFGRDAAGFASGTLRFAQKNGVALRAHSLLSGFIDYEVGLAFIKEGLHKGSPLALLTARNQHPLWHYNPNPALPPHQAQAVLQSHFVTIAGLRQGAAGPQLLVSSWGRMYMVEYDALFKSWQKPSSLGAALFYFTAEGNLAQSKRQALVLYSLLPATLAKTMLGTLGMPIKALAKQRK